jgi:ATP-binding cassette subfamily F protein 3
MNESATSGSKALPGTGDNVLSVTDVSIGYNKSVLASGITFLLRRGERLGIIGPNGSGKTTFLKTVLDKLQPLGGGLTWGANVNIEYFDQELSSLDLTSTVYRGNRRRSPTRGAG